ncbi:unnamed protein product [Heligmosomoides polygyrus]|uniref:Peptidase S1 domain-containing protein n=1 Tax=Heligmosomoides polygyrus TaxID=6339 RepID=A0A183FGL1_HELPZ|nr:unnamed protein product [Heligmosomoides polygyrus]
MLLFQPVFYNYFNPCTFYGDIAVIELDRDINPSEGKPICMPGKDELLARNFSAVGYGIDRRRTGRPVRYLNVATMEPISGQPGYMDCSAALLQNMCLMSSASQERHRARLQYTLTLQTDTTGHNGRLSFSIPLLQKLATVTNEPPPKLRRRDFSLVFPAMSVSISAIQNKFFPLAKLEEI